MCSGGGGGGGGGERIQPRKLHSCIWRDLIKPSLRFSFFMCSFFPKATFWILFFLNCSWCKCHVAAVKRLPVLHHNAVYIFIFISFGIIEPMLVTLKIEYSLWRCWVRGFGGAGGGGGGGRMQPRKLYSCIWRNYIKSGLWISVFYVFFLS